MLHPAGMQACTRTGIHLDVRAMTTALHCAPQYTQQTQVVPRVCGTRQRDNMRQSTWSAPRAHKPKRRSHAPPLASNVVFMNLNWQARVRTNAYKDAQAHASFFGF